MTTSEVRESIRKLSVAERIELVEMIWEDLGEDLPDVDLTKEQQQELSQRIATYEADPENVLPWELVRASLQKRLQEEAHPEGTEGRWYCAHAELYFKYLEGPQTDYVVWEHLYLIEANSFDDAIAKAGARAQEDEGGSSMTLERNAQKRQATLTFAGIRKVVSCQDLDLSTKLPVHGTELSYSEFLLETEEAFNRLVRGEDAKLIYCDA